MDGIVNEKVAGSLAVADEALAMARGEGKTVMVDFSANWCPTCKLNLRFAVDTEKVAQVVERNHVAPMLADWTDRSPVIKRTLNE